MVVVFQQLFFYRDIIFLVSTFFNETCDIKHLNKCSKERELIELTDKTDGLSPSNINFKHGIFNHIQPSAVLLHNSLLVVLMVID